MSDSPSHEITRILGQMRGGDDTAFKRLLPLVYGELRALAGEIFQRQPPDHMLQPTALVHEAYLRLVRQPPGQWKDRAHFMAVACRAMRNLLIDHARARSAGKRGGGRRRVALDKLIDSASERSIDVLVLDEALEELTLLHERQARVVELRFFGGMTVKEIAMALEVSPSTIETDWTVARAWLTRRLASGDDR